MKALPYLLILTIAGLFISFVRPNNTAKMNQKADDLILTILYNNYNHNSELKSDWGFSCLIEGMDKTILFDSGTNGKILLENMKKMGKNPEDVDIVILSHEHGDHVGGLKMFLEKNSEVKVYIPESFPEKIGSMVTESGAILYRIKDHKKITDNLYTTGEMGSDIIEQSIVITTDKGNLVITGCAHPGIVDIVKKSAEIAGDDLLLVMGGFHLLRHDEDEVKEIIAVFKKMGVVYAAPTHCSGDKTLEAFKTSFGDHYVELGAGKVLNISELN
jgi:7,8-dihydropterin-6-yl-methyl-4-(beta-D-ribofuranosyl)aminobenzene 5'-phosphate synthase